MIFDQFQTSAVTDSYLVSYRTAKADLEAAKQKFEEDPSSDNLDRLAVIQEEHDYQAKMLAHFIEIDLMQHGG